MSPSEQHVQSELRRLADLAPAIEDPRIAEQVFVLVGVVTILRELHQVNAKNKCLRCRPNGKHLVWRRWQACGVRGAFDNLQTPLPATGDRE